MGPIAAGLAARVELGASLSDAMSAYPEVFSDGYRDTIRIAEEEGTLAEVFYLLVDELRRALRAALLLLATKPLVDPFTQRSPRSARPRAVPVSTIAR